MFRYYAARLFNITSFALDYYFSCATATNFVSHHRRRSADVVNALMLSCVTV